MLPHWITFKLKQPQSSPPSSSSLPTQNSDCISTIGWHCWHSFKTNPKVCLVHVSTDGFSYRLWDTFQAKSHYKGDQLFTCEGIDPALYPFITLTVTETYGATQTYMSSFRTSNR